MSIEGSENSEQFLNCYFEGFVRLGTEITTAPPVLLRLFFSSYFWNDISIVHFADDHGALKIRNKFIALELPITRKT